MLRNGFYLGQVKYKGQLLPGQHPAIVTQELFDQVQRMRREHYIGPSIHAPRYFTWPR